jgi:putative ABC transport system permease protein
MTLAYVVARGLFRKPLRAALTICAITAAFLVFGVLGAAREALSGGATPGSAERLIVINKASFTLPLPYAYVARVRAIDGIAGATFADWFGGYFQNPREFFATLAVDAPTYLDLYPEFIVSPESRSAFEARRDTALVGETLARRFGWKAGDTVPLASNIFRKADGNAVWDVLIVGVFHPGSETVNTNTLLFHHEYLADALALDRDEIGWLVVRGRDLRDNEALAARIDRAFANSAAETETTTEQVFGAAFANQMGDIGKVVTYVAAAAFFSILLISASTMMLAADERVREFATLKALGFSPRLVLGLILGESTLLAVMGGSAGLLLAALALRSIRASLPDFPPMLLTPDVLLEAGAVMVALGMLTGLAPAARISRLSVVEALRRE